MCAAQVLDLFRKMDIDESGTIDKSEFRRAMTSLGFDAKDAGPWRDRWAQVDAIFDEFDDDKGGSVTHEELVRGIIALPFAPVDWSTLNLTPDRI